MFIYPNSLQLKFIEYIRDITQTCRYNTCILWSL